MLMKGTKLEFCWGLYLLLLLDVKYYIYYIGSVAPNICHSGYQHSAVYITHSWRFEGNQWYHCVYVGSRAMTPSIHSRVMHLTLKIRQGRCNCSLVKRTSIDE